MEPPSAPIRSSLKLDKRFPTPLWKPSPDSLVTIGLNQVPLMPADFPFPKEAGSLSFFLGRFCRYHREDRGVASSIDDNTVGLVMLAVAKTGVFDLIDLISSSTW